MSWRWLLENPQILFVIAGAIAYWLNERRKLKETKREAEQELAREPTDDEMAERTRRIQEEIRRKIEERQGRIPQPPPLFEEENVEGPASLPPPLPQLRPVLVSTEETPGAAELERVMEQQRRYAEQLRQLENSSRNAPTEVTMAPAASFAAATPAPVRRGLDLLPALHDRAALRRAILLREILGPAKGLQ